VLVRSRVCLSAFRAAMSRQEVGEAIVRIIDDEPTVSVQVSWKGAELNLLRAKEELVERFVQRLGISCGKHHCTGGSTKKAKKEKKKPAVIDGNGKRPEASGGVAVSIIGKDGARVADGLSVVEALQQASSIEIEGEHLPIRLNPASIKKLEVYGRALAGCPVVASMYCEFCKPESFKLKWMVQVPGTGEGSGTHCLGEGKVLWLPKASGGQTLTLRAESIEAEDIGRVAGIVRVGLVDEVPQGWPERRLEAFGDRGQPSVEGSHRIRVVSFNILAAPYARTISATRDMYPYCPAHALDFAYRQPLCGRELAKLDADVVCLQECSYSTCWKFLAPLFGEKYHIRVTLKANAMSEGCALLIRREAFEVIEERDFLFKELLVNSPAFSQTVEEVKARWPDFLTGVLPHMATAFQLTVLRHKASGTTIVVSNTHLFFHPRARHIRLLQAMCLLQQVHELREKHTAGGVPPRLLLCGDFNCTPDQAVVNFLLQGEIAADHPDWEMAGEFKWERNQDELLSDDEGAEEATTANASSSTAPAKAAEASTGGMGLALRSPLGSLSNAYASEPMAFTNYVNDFNGSLDYILTGPGLHSVKRLPGVSEEDLKPHGGLPNDHYPSDHLSIAVDLELQVDYQQ